MRNSALLIKSQQERECKNPDFSTTDTTGMASEFLNRDFLEWMIADFSLIDRESGSYADFVLKYNSGSCSYPAPLPVPLPCKALQLHSCIMNSNSGNPAMGILTALNHQVRSAGKVRS